MLSLSTSPILASCLLLSLGAVGGSPAPTTTSPRPPDMVPLGVYLSWERIGANAKVAGIDPWTDLQMRLDALRLAHVNLLWITNMSEKDLPRLLDECSKRDIRVLPSMGSIEAKVDWRWAKGSTYYDTRVPQVVALAKDNPTLAGWVLSDEPKVDIFPRLQQLHRRFRHADPQRFCTAVTMWPQTPAIARDLDLPVVCVDLYPFFGPNDPNGPHTDAASKSFFRRNAAAMMDAIGTRDKIGWVMGMCFSDIWGPRRYNAEGHLIGLPGSYLHWRAPTLAEMRWQVWETFRAGAKGFVCYTLAPEAPNPKTETLAPADVTWKNVLAKKPTDLGPNALTNPDGGMTPQLAELGRVYARLAPQLDLLRHWRRSGRALLEVETPGMGQLFHDPRTGRIYAIVLNDDLRRQHSVAIRVGEKVTGVRDLLSGNPLSLTRDFAGGSATGTLDLAAGDGTILILEMPDEKTP